MPSAQTTVDAARLMKGPLVISPASWAIDTLAHHTWRTIQCAECTSCGRDERREKWLTQVNRRLGPVRLEWMVR